MSFSDGRDLRVSPTRLDGPSAPRAAWAAAGSVLALLVVIALAGRGGGSGGSPVATASAPAPAMAPPAATAPAVATANDPAAAPVPRPTRIAPFILQATADGPATFVSPNLGFAFQDRGDDDAAIDHFNEAIRIKPGFAEAHNALGVVLLRHGQADRAMEQYGRVYRETFGLFGGMDPNQAVALSVLYSISVILVTIPGGVLFALGATKRRTPPMSFEKREV